MNRLQTILSVPARDRMPCTYLIYLLGPVRDVWLELEPLEVRHHQLWHHLGDVLPVVRVAHPGAPSPVLVDGDVLEALGGRFERPESSGCLAMLRIRTSSCTRGAY